MICREGRRHRYNNARYKWGTLGVERQILMAKYKGGGGEEVTTGGVLLGVTRGHIWSLDPSLAWVVNPKIQITFLILTLDYMF